MKEIDNSKILETENSNAFMDRHFSGCYTLFLFANPRTYMVESRVNESGCIRVCGLDVNHFTCCSGLFC